MRKDTTIQSLYTGLIFLGVCLLGMMTKLGFLVVIVSHFLPGLVFGVLIVSNINFEVSEKRKILFVLLSTAIHITCVLCVDVKNEEKIWTPIKLIAASSLGALLTTSTFDLVLARKISFKRTFIVALFLGGFASLTSAFCMYYLHQVDFEQDLINGFVWAGIFSIFPLWFSLVAWNLKRSHKGSS